MRGTVKWMNGNGHTMVGWDTDLKKDEYYVEDGTRYVTADAAEEFLRTQVEGHRIVADPVKKEIVRKPGERFRRVDLTKHESLIIFPRMAGG